jgi:SAM-dependent methyltransferase
MSTNAKAAYPFLEVNCPLCGGNDFEVLRKAGYPPDFSVAQLQTVYRASSDHQLLDQVVKCHSCGMIYLDPRLEASLIQSGYEEMVDPVFVEQNQHRIATFSSGVQSILAKTGFNPAGKKLLDVGCAGGAFLVAARAAGFEVSGVEPSRWLGDFARREYGCDVKQGILADGMFPEHSFDVISLWDVLEHVPDPHAVLRTIRSLIKPNGYLWVNYPDAGSFMAKVLGWKWPFWLSVHLIYYNRSTIRRQLEKAGFAISYIRPHWQQLQFGYVLDRAGALVPPAKVAAKIVRGIGLGKVAVTYNMGQTLVVAQPDSRS